MPTARAWLLREPVLLGVLLVVLTLVAYGRVFALGFVNIDDQPYVTENPHVLSGLSWSGIAWAFTNTKESYWHPLTWLSLMLDSTIGGPGPTVYHVTNLLLHIANTLLLYRVLSGMTGLDRRSAFVAGLFAVHPLHVESVAWVVERKDVLSTFFMLSTLAAYGRYASRPSPGRYAVMALGFALGLMAKPMLVTLPVVLLLLDYWPLGRLDGARRLALEKVPLLLLALASSVITLAAKGAGVRPLEDYRFVDRVTNALVSYAGYIGKMLLPRNLSAFYPHPHGAIPPWEIGGAAALLAAVSVFAVLMRRRRPWLFVGWFWYGVTLLPVIGLIQAGLQGMADRYTYVPLIGLFIVVAWGVPDLAIALRRWTGFSPLDRMLGTLAVAVLVLLSALTSVQVQYWKDGIVLWRHALEATRDNPVAHNDLALLLANRGEVDEAVSHLREALKIAPWFLEAHFNLTNTLMGMGKLEEAAALCRDEESRWPDDDRTHVDLGLLALLRQDSTEAERQFLEALRLNPDEVYAHMNLAWIRAGEGRVAEANAYFVEVVRIVGPDRAWQLGKGQFPLSTSSR